MADLIEGFALGLVEQFSKITIVLGCQEIIALCKIRQHLELSLFESLNPGDESAINKDGPLACGRMDLDEGVHWLHRVFANQAAKCLCIGDHV